MAKKYIAYKMSTENTTWPLEWCYTENGLDFSGTVYEGFILTGNRDFGGYETEAFRQIQENFDNMAESWEMDLERSRYDEKSGRWEYYQIKTHSASLTSFLSEYGFCREDGKPWTPKQVKKWRELLASGLYSDDDEIILPALELLTGEVYDTKTLQGYSQGDWIECYYPVEYADLVDYLEAEYFRMVDEYGVTIERVEVDADTDFDELRETADICYGYYCYEWGEDKQREELANNLGCTPEDIIICEPEERHIIYYGIA